MSGSMICPTCKGNGFVWVETPEPKKDRWAADCTACNNQGEIPITDYDLEYYSIYRMKPFGILFNL
jgi:hypothetical protein